MPVEGLRALPASRTEAVGADIRRAILDRELLPGQPLVEADLAARYGVSKTPVREALKELAGSGLVVISPYRGATVREVTPDWARDVCDLRLLLEPEAVRRAALAGDPEPYRAAAAVLDSAADLLTGDDHAQLSLLNRRFHHELYRGCGNALLVAQLDELRDRAALISVAGWAARPTWRAEWKEHRAVLRAASAGHADQAADLVRQHIQEFRDRVLAALTD